MPFFLFLDDSNKAMTTSESPVSEETETTQQSLRPKGKTIAVMPAYNAATTLKKTIDDCSTWYR